VHCDVNRISCQLDRIADSLGGFDWNSFTATLLATMAGALIAAFAAMFVYRGERGERYRSSMDDAAVDVMTALHDYSQQYRTFLRDITDYYAASMLANQTASRPADPDRARLDIALDVLIVKGRKEDKQVAQRLKGVVYELTFTEDSEWLAKEYQTVRRIVAAWRSAHRTPHATIRNLGIVEQRREMKQAGKPEKDMPPAPEPYKGRAVAQPAASGAEASGEPANFRLSADG